MGFQDRVGILARDSISVKNINTITTHTFEADLS